MTAQPPTARDARTVPPRDLGVEMQREAQRMRGSRPSAWFQALEAAAWDHNEAQGSHQPPRTKRPACPGGPIAVPSPEPTRRARAQEMTTRLRQERTSATPAPRAEPAATGAPLTLF